MMNPRNLSSVDILQWASGLSIVLVLIFVCAWLLRRLGQISNVGGSKLRVLGGVSVGARERVVLVQVGNNQLVLGVAPGRVQTLHVVDQADLSTDIELESENQEQPSFSQRFQQVLGRG